LPFLFVNDPRWGVAWVIVLSGIGLCAMDRALVRFGAAGSFRVAVVTFLAWSTNHTRWSNTLWNANLFYFVTPVALYCVARLITEKKDDLGSAATFGLMTAAAAQLHLGGLMMPMVLLGVLLIHQPQALSWKRAGVFVAALAFAYLPYVLAEAQVQFANLKAFHRPEPWGQGFNVAAAQRSLLAPVVYPSHAEMHLLSPSLAALEQGLGAGWWRIAIALSALATGALALIGVVTRFPLKLAPLAFHLGVPLYFTSIQRPYFDHYVGALMPFGVLLASGGCAWLMSKKGPLRVAAASYLAAFALVGAVLPHTSGYVLREGDPWNGYTVKAMLERTEQELASGLPVRSGGRDELGYTRATLARWVLGKELKFALGQYICTVDLMLTGLDPPLPERHPGKVFFPLASNSVYVCEPPR
jgi:hypothetical protein